MPMPNYDGLFYAQASTIRVEEKNDKPRVVIGWKLLKHFNPEMSKWIDIRRDHLSIVGFYFLTNDDGRLNQINYDSMVRSFGWDGRDLAALQAEQNKQHVVQLLVKWGTYNGQDRLEAQSPRPWDDAGVIRPATKEELAALKKYSTVFISAAQTLGHVNPPKPFESHAIAPGEDTRDLDEAEARERAAAAGTNGNGNGHGRQSASAGAPPVAQESAPAFDDEEEEGGATSGSSDPIPVDEATDEQLIASVEEWIKAKAEDSNLPREKAIELFTTIKAKDGKFYSQTSMEYFTDASVGEDEKRKRMNWLRKCAKKLESTNDFAVYAFDAVPF